MHQTSADPLSSLTLGNSLTGTRGFEDRYFPSSLSLTGISQLLDWTYSTDAVLNQCGLPMVIVSVEKGKIKTINWTHNPGSYNASGS